MKISSYLFRSTVWVMGTRAGNALLNILISAILARLLNPENLGNYFLIFSVVTISSNLVRCGQGAAAIRLIAEAEALGQLGRARQTVLITLFGVSAIALLFSAAYYIFIGNWLFTEFFRSPAVLTLTGLVALWIVIVGLRTQVASIFRGMHAVRLAATFNGFISTFVTLILIAYLYTRPAMPNLGEVVMFSIAGAAVGLLASFVFLYANLKKFKGEGSIRVSEISSISLPLFLVALASMVLTHGDLILAGNLFGEKEIAFYGVAVRLKGIVMLQMLVLGTVMSPVIARLFAQKENVKLEKVMRLMSTIAAVPIILMILLLFFVGEPLIAWIFGEVYRDAYPILMVLLFGLLISAIMGSGQQLMMMTGHERMLLPIRIIGGLCAILGGILAAPSMGIVGLALAFSLSTAGVNVAMTLAAKKLTGISCYVLTPSYFMNAQNRRALTQELFRLIRESMGRRRRSENKTPDDG